MFDAQIASDKPLQISPIYLSGEMKKVTTYRIGYTQLFSVFNYGYFMVKNDTLLC